MAGIVTTDLTFFTGATGGSTSTCNATTDWSGSPTLDTEVMVEGTGSLSAKISKATGIYMYSLATSVDLSDTLIFAWMNSTQASGLATKANGGLTIRVSSNVSSGVDYGDWYVAGSDTYAGSWECFVVRTNAAFDNSSGSPNKAAILHVGVTCNQTAAGSKINFWFDGIRYGTYVQVAGGTSGAPASFADFMTAEGTYSYGAFIEKEGVLMAQAKVYIGDPTSGNTYFKDTSKVLVFRDRPFGTFYTLTGRGNATGDTQIYFGEESGGQGISGCVIRSVGVAKFSLDFSDQYIDNLGLYGCLFYDASTTVLPAYDVNKEVLSCTFEACGIVTPNTGKMEYCNFVSADTDAMTLSSNTLNVKYCVFIDPGNHAIVLTYGGGNYDFYGMTFYGTAAIGPYDLENTTALSFTVNNLAGSTTTYIEETGGGTVTIATGVDLTITVLDLSNNGIENAQCSIYKLSDDTQLMNEDSVITTGIATETFNYPGSVVDIYWRVRKSSSGTTRYRSQSGTGQINTSGFSVTVTLVEEPLN